VRKVFGGWGKSFLGMLGLVIHLGSKIVLPGVEFVGKTTEVDF
jgi:hypothetical protein